jgi:hypothetical protein
VITQLLQKTPLSHLQSLVSPTFLDVVPGPTLWRRGKALVDKYRDDDGFADALEEREVTLADADLPIHPKPGGPSRARVPEKPSDYAQKVVTLYFHQLWTGEAAIIDLRASALTEDPHDAERIIWHPGSMWTVWDEDFRAHLRDVYAGFYGDDRSRFESGLEALGLGGASELFERHFGEDLEATRFELEDFIGTFHDIFLFCRERNIELAGEFLSLGIYLATLYENLDRLDVTVNVRRCVERVTEDEMR